MPTTWHAAAVLCCGLLAHAPQAPAASSAQPVANAAISGVVRSSAGAAIPRARIVAQPDGDAAPRVTLSDKEGAYTMADLPPGAYVVSASKSGFAGRTYGDRRTEPPRPVEVAAGQRASGVDFTLVPSGVIPGRILDSDGSPLAGARVDALQSRYEDGQHVLKPVATATTDDRGEFRLFGIAPGEYYVSASDPAFNTVGSAGGPLHYAPTYFPGTSFSDEARAVTVPERGEAPRIEFAIRLVPPATVTGQLLTNDRRQLLSGAVIMTAKEANGVPVAPPESVSILPDGRFTFAGVPPGHYTIRARGITDPNGLALFAQYGVKVEGQDVEGIQMTLERGALLDGTVSVVRRHGSPPPALTSLRVRAPFPDGSDFGDALTGRVDAQGRFEIRGLMLGDHQIVVNGLDRPWTVQSIEWRGHDITDELIEADEDTTFKDVRIAIVDEGSDVSGTVRNASRTPVRDAGVLIYPVGTAFRVRAGRRMRAARTDADGRYSVYGLPPGDYLAVAAHAIDAGDLGRPRELERLQPLATPLTIGSPDAHITLDLRVADTLGSPASTPPASR